MSVSLYLKIVYIDEKASAHKCHSLTLPAYKYISYTENPVIFKLCSFYIHGICRLGLLYDPVKQMLVQIVSCH